MADENQVILTDKIVIAISACSMGGTMEKEAKVIQSPNTEAFVQDLTIYYSDQL